MQYYMQYWIQIFFLDPKLFDLDFLDQTFFGTNVFEKKRTTTKTTTTTTILMDFATIEINLVFNYYQPFQDFEYD